MALPERIRVKLSSEAGGSVSLTPVVVQEMSAGDLVELIAGVSGKDIERVVELLKRGSLVSGATRYRWEGLSAAPQDLAEVLRGLPDPDPSRPFQASNCVKAILLGQAFRLELPKDTANQRRLLRPRSYWHELVQATQSSPPTYVTYLYREKVDQYRLDLSTDLSTRLREAASLLPFRGLAAQITAARLAAVDLYVPR